ncbi:putative membrane protein [Aeromonas caviae]|nr:putative membrane protein [Aeromonas caviae]
MANEKELAWMLKPELLTALHYCSVITLTGAITSEYFLFRRGMSIEQVRKLLLADSLAALALLLIFITGVLLVVAHPQPPAILFANPGYRTKLLMFFAMAISFGYPSRLFHHWRRSLRQGRAPLVSTQQQFWVIWILRGNLLLLALLPLLAKLASR